MLGLRRPDRGREPLERPRSPALPVVWPRLLAGTRCRGAPAALRRGVLRGVPRRRELRGRSEAAAIRVGPAHRVRAPLRRGAASCSRSEPLPATSSKPHAMRATSRWGSSPPPTSRGAPRSAPVFRSSRDSSRTSSSLARSSTSRARGTSSSTSANRGPRSSGYATRSSRGPRCSSRFRTSTACRRVDVARNGRTWISGHHVGHYTPAALRALLTSAGFRDVTIETYPMRAYLRPGRALRPIEVAAALNEVATVRALPWQAHPSKHEMLRAAATAP